MCRKKEKIVLLLGAGFAIPWGGPSSKDIKEKLYSDEEYGEIARFLFKKLEEYYAYGVNFETYIAALENILNYIMSSTNIGRRTDNSNLQPIIFDIQTEILLKLDEFRNKKNSLEDLRVFVAELYKRTIEAILSLINYDSDISNKPISQNFIKFIEFLKKRYKQVKIYTTNYDRIVPNLLGEIDECLTEDNVKGDPTIKRFYYRANQFNKSSLTFFNLHGSAYWGKRTYYLPYEVVSYTIPRMTFDFLGQQGGNPSDNMFFVPIITGYNKLQRLNTFPFNFGFNAFMNDCNSCDTFVSIGYSFGDSHLNSIMSQFIDWEKQTYLHISKSDEKTEGQNINREITYFTDGVFKWCNAKYTDDMMWMKYSSGSFNFYAYTNGVEEFFQNQNNWHCL